MSRKDLANWATRRRISGDQQLRTRFDTITRPPAGPMGCRILTSSYAAAAVPEVTRTVPQGNCCRHRLFSSSPELSRSSFALLMVLWTLFRPSRTALQLPYPWHPVLPRGLYRKQTAWIGWLQRMVVGVQVLAFSGVCGIRVIRGAFGGREPCGHGFFKWGSSTRAGRNTDCNWSSSSHTVKGKFPRFIMRCCWLWKFPPP